MRKKRSRKDKLSFLIISLILVGIGVFILLRQFNDNLIFFYTPSELASLQKIDTNKLIRVGGVVQPNSIKKNGKKVSFVIADYENILAVTYEGMVPMLFKEGQAAVAKGKVFSTKEGLHFVATEILAKHDEYYMPKQVEAKSGSSKMQKIYLN